MSGARAACCSAPGCFCTACTSDSRLEPGLELIPESPLSRMKEYTMNDPRMSNKLYLSQGIQAYKGGEALVTPKVLRQLTALPSSC